MISQKKSKHVSMNSCLLKLLPRELKTKTKINQQTTIKNNRKIKKQQKSKSNGKYNTYHGPLSQKWIDGRYRSLFLHVMLTQVMSNLSPGFTVVLESIHNNPLSRLY